MKLIWLLCRSSKLTCFLNAGRKSIAFSVSMQIYLHFVWVVRIYLISVWGIELDLVPVQDELDLVLVWVVKNEFISVLRIGIDLVLV